MSGIKPRLVRSLKKSDTHWVEELDSVLSGLRTTPNRTIGYTQFFMVYDAEAVLPCDIIHDSPRVRMYEERETELDRHDSLDAWRRSATSQKPVPHSINSKLADTKTGKCGPRLIMLVNSFYARREEREQTQAQVGGSLPH